MSNKSKWDDDPPFETTAAYINAAPWRAERDRIECEEAFIRAAQHGRTALVKAFLAAGANVHAQEERALAYASANGHEETVKVLLAADAKPNSGHLFLAASNGRAQITKLLIKAGVDVHADEDKALRNAVNSSPDDEYLETVDVLLEEGADLHVNNDWCLKIAVSRAKYGIVAALLEAGADITVIGETELGKARVNELGCGPTPGRKDRIKDNLEISDTVALVKLWHKKRLALTPG